MTGEFCFLPRSWTFPKTVLPLLMSDFQPRRPKGAAMSQGPHPNPSIQVSCTVCELLHTPALLDTSHPICGMCAQSAGTVDRLPLPVWMPSRRDPLDTP